MKTDPQISDDPQIERLLLDVGTSYWLRDLVTSACRRDPVDVVHDLEHATLAFRAALDRIFEASGAALIDPDQTQH